MHPHLVKLKTLYDQIYEPAITRISDIHIQWVIVWIWMIDLRACKLKQNWGLQEKPISPYASVSLRPK